MRRISLYARLLRVSRDSKANGKCLTSGPGSCVAQQKTAEESQGGRLQIQDHSKIALDGTHLRA